MSEQPKEIVMSDQLKEIIDTLYMWGRERFAVSIGIWDGGEVPYTLYATLNDEDGSVRLGESSYGSRTMEEAIGCLYSEICERDGAA